MKSVREHINKNTLFIIILALFTVGILGRFLPHMPNATPITALAIVSSIYFGRRVSFVLPLSVLFFSDLIIGFYSLGIMASVYGSFALIILLSTWLQKHRGFFPVFYFILGSSVSFFLITNAAVWWFSPWYEKSFSGLLYSYKLGLPFLRNMLVGDLIYTYTLLGAFSLLPYMLNALRLIPTFSRRRHGHITIE